MNINNFSQNDLILFCLFKIQQVKEDATFERLVYECFTTFPERFSFYTYRLPDSIKLDRQLRTLRRLKLISGNNKFGFKLTEKGQRLAMQLQEIIESSHTNATPNNSILLKTKGGRKEELIINQVTTSHLFKQYQVDRDAKFSIDEIRIVFFGTLETPLKSILENIEYVEKIAKRSQNTNLLAFIDKCKRAIKTKG